MTNPSHPGPLSHAERIIRVALAAARETGLDLHPEFREALKREAQHLADELQREAWARRQRARRKRA